MIIYTVDTDESYKDFQSLIESKDAVILKKDNNIWDVRYYNEVFKFEINNRYINTPVDDIVHGKNKETNIVNISFKNESVYIFKEYDDTVSYEQIPYKHWILTEKPLPDSTRLKGEQTYKWLKELSYKEFSETKSLYYKINAYTMYNQSEAFMTRYGYTYFKGMKSTDVSVLSFDIETSGLDANAKDAKVYLITNTFRKNSEMISKTFNVEDYNSDKDMILAWAEWVKKLDPSVMLGHNIVMFDLPYITARVDGTLNIGRLNTNLEIEDKVREFRKDGSQSYSYNRINIFGREIVDTFFLAIKADIARKYENYRLKNIIKQENMEEADRQHYDGGAIRDNWDNPEERKKIVAYAEADSRDPIKLFDLMIPSFFYLTPYIPKTFQVMIESASGSQINSLMVRSYLQEGFSVAQGSPAIEFEGAISFGNVGIYDNVFKVDVASLYPSIMRHHKVYPKSKDYNSNFLIMLNYFTEERLKNKQLAKTSGERFYDDLQNAQKVVINSAYGFMGAKGLNYNYPEGAATVTRYGREIIKKALWWASTRNFNIANCDTDSISFPVGRSLTDEERKEILKDLNSNYPDAIKFEDDGFYKTFCILAAKNYIIQTMDGKIKLKGSSLKDQKKEPALREMVDKMISLIVERKELGLIDIYKDYIRECYSVKDIKRWAAKKTVTKPVLNCRDNPEARLNERKVYDAVKDMSGLQEGDKVYLYPCILKEEIITKTQANGKVKQKVIRENGLKLVENWTNDHDPDKLLGRVVTCVDIFSGVVDGTQFIDYTLVKNKNLLQEVLNEKIASI